MSYIQYTPTDTAWNNVQGQVYGEDFYPIQKGEGGNIQMVSPVQASLDRAKSELKRQLSNPDDHSPPSKRRRHITHSITNPSKKKQKPKKKTSLKSKKKSVKKKSVKKTKKKKTSVIKKKKRKVVKKRKTKK